MLNIGIIIAIVVVCLILLILGKLYFSGRSCHITKDLTGKVIIITGGNTGIGRATALGLAQMNATVILACRDPHKSQAAVQYISKTTKNPNVHYMRLDLADLGSIKEFVEKFKLTYRRLDILINNAGILAQSERQVTKNEFESQLGVNHLGHFYLTNLLLDYIKESAPSRIVNVSSMAHRMGKMHWKDLMLERGYKKWKAYSQSKLANILFTKELQKKLDKDGDDVKVVCLHPGMVKTELFRNELWYGKVIGCLIFPGLWYFLKTPVQGAQTTLQCALEEHEELVSGGYYDNCRIAKPSKEALSPTDAQMLWERSEKLVYIGEYESPVISTE